MNLDPASTASAVPKPHARFGLLPFLAWFCVIACVIATTVLFARNGTHLKGLLQSIGMDRSLPVKEAPIAVKPTPQTRKGDRLKELEAVKDLVAPPPPVVISNEPDGPFDAEKVCGDFKTTGFPTATWQQSNTGDWECSALVEFPGQAPPSSIFLQMKGHGKDNLHVFRLKLNLENIPDRQSIFMAATLASVPLLKHMGEDAVTQFSGKIAALTEFTTESHGYKLALKRERGFVPRYNFTAVGGFSKKQPTTDTAPPDVSEQP